MAVRTVKADTKGRYNAAVDLLGRNLAAGRSDRVYLIDDGRLWSYQEVSALADAVGAGLLALGLVQGDRVIIALRDRPEFVATFWGAIKAGLVAVPVAQGLTAADLRFILTDSDARAAICDESSAASVLTAADGTSARCIAVGPVAAPALAWSDMCAPGARLEAANTGPDDIALWLYTSGTTGLAKAAMHRHRTLRDASRSLAQHIIGMSADDRILSVSRMFFAYGLGNSVHLPAAFGASVVINQRPVVPALIHDLLHSRNPTLLFGVPAFFDGLARLDTARLPVSVRMVLSAGEALNAQLFERFHRRFGLPLLDGLGATEALHHFTCNRPDDVVAGSAGRALPGFDIEARDPDDRPVAEGERGELWVRGPTTFAGYWKRPDLSARAFRGEWMRTGDVVRIVDGRVFHEGRLDDLMKLGGVWVAPVEIETVLRDHPDVVDAAVVTLDEGHGIPTLKAYVTSGRSDGRLSRELRDFCRGRLAVFKIPQTFEQVEALPRTQTGKIRRFLLRQSGAEVRASSDGRQDP